MYEFVAMKIYGFELNSISHFKFDSVKKTQTCDLIMSESLLD